MGGEGVRGAGVRCERWVCGGGGVGGRVVRRMWGVGWRGGVVEEGGGAGGGEGEGGGGGGGVGGGGGEEGGREGGGEGGVVSEEGEEEK